MLLERHKNNIFDQFLKFNKKPKEKKSIYSIQFLIMVKKNMLFNYLYNIAYKINPNYLMILN